MKQLGSWLLPQLAKLSPGTEQLVWDTLMQVCLWGNKCNLSISVGDRAVASGDPDSALEQLQGNILTDNKGEAWQCTVDRGKRATLDIMMDNSGFELFTDLCLAEFLVKSGTSPGSCPTQPHRTSPGPSTSCPEGWTIWTLWGSWLIGGAHTYNLGHSFWTFPHSFNMMASTDLYERLGEADLLIFKGDLNYMKLVGDLNWETTVTIKSTLHCSCPRHPVPDDGQG